MKNKLEHIAFIMDGNNRWSKKNNKKHYDAYLAGANKLIKVSKYIFDTQDVKYISAFALSKNNLKRSSTIISTLKNVLKFFIDNYSNNLEYNFQIIFKGDKSFLSSYLLNNINRLESINKDSKKKLLIYMNYSGQDDVINSFKKIYSSKIKFNKKNFLRNLITKNIPNPDLLIRTGGYQRISDFMLYQLSFTELIFTKILWPDLTNKSIDKFILSFNKTERKFGI